MTVDHTAGKENNSQQNGKKTNHFSRKKTYIKNNIPEKWKKTKKKEQKRGTWTKVKWIWTK